MTGAPLCELSDLDDPGSLAVTAQISGAEKNLMIVRQGGGIQAYVNVCPHVGTPLDFQPGRFLNIDKTYIICATHGALFRIDNGLCISGPCVGKSLQKIDIVLDPETDVIRVSQER